MPRRAKPIRLKTPIPKANYLQEYFRRVMKSRKISSTDIANYFGCTDSNVRYLLSRPQESWQIKEIKMFCSVLDVPFSDALNTLVIGGK